MPFSAAVSTAAVRRREPFAMSSSVHLPDVIMHTIGRFGLIIIAFMRCGLAPEHGNTFIKIREFPKTDNEI